MNQLITFEEKGLIYWYSQAPTPQAMLASVGKEVMLLDGWTSSVLRSFAVASEVVANILQGI